MTKTEKRVLLFRDMAFLTIWAYGKEIEFMVIWYHRTDVEQNKQYQKGRMPPDKKKIVTNCDGYNKRSPHQAWIAIDLVIIENNKLIWVSPKYKILGKKWMEMGRRWGGKFKSLKGDLGHFQL